jgi:hypothetical protein
MNKQSNRRNSKPVGVPSFIIKIAQFAVGGLDFLGIDLWVVGEDVLPPSLIVYLLEMNENSFVIL